MSSQPDHVAVAEDVVLSVRDLRTDVATPSGRKTVVKGLSFDLKRGETLCIAGESGSGKSITALSIMGLLPEPMARVSGGEVLFQGKDLIKLPEDAMRRIRGGDIAMIFQEPMTSLNPVLTVGRQLREAILAHQDVSGSEANKRALAMLESVRLSEPARRLKQYPHELSGGMRQRVMIAMALACNPKVLIADEPTTALDVTIQAQILQLIRDLQRDFGTAVIMITHDMGVVAEMADRVIVMNHGNIVESGTASDVFERPADTYTRHLLEAVPKLGAMTGVDSAARKKDQPEAPVLEVEDLVVRFDLHGGLLNRVTSRVHAVEGVSFTLAPGETLGLVGESGCGKSTIGKALMNLVPWEGSIRIAGQHVGIGSAQEQQRRRRDMQMIFQDPYASLDPRMTVGDIVGEPLVIHGLARGKDLKDKVASLFDRVGLPADVITRHPHEFSGGQRQRICIARALALSPKVIVADESVSALDVSVQARVLDLLQELQEDLGLAYLFISHDMAVVEQVSHRIAVMYLGQIVEMGTRRQVFENPQHDYTKRLLKAVPIPDPKRRRTVFDVPTGEIPSPVLPLGQSVERVRYHDVGDRHLVAVA
ncbi:Glutathione import ATP-binding protein GsiA [Labrenzia sp. THAF191b]|uniref:ABC transporter ATP-binding protein n=1 Tax=unclassified Labrenzia TaxID=2648686 RepID=UPI001268FD95|nr:MULTISPECIES: ABC transporter ATP-binding protein [unclassified Labrenzia]QFS96804.1 Glutathione import ATP-binding protein GsiA [Labrenzia sp. THAF191b]QFT03119.1 Glutathione import ATP-binding protein GsiA [Labrenzia sp. THAF191a]QFT14661.1 Glutathione import ATP-binding protein GsiA [Labrenzia sp. THAF187b]